MQMRIILLSITALLLLSSSLPVSAAPGSQQPDPPDTGHAPLLIPEEEFFINQMIEDSEEIDEGSSISGLDLLAARPTRITVQGHADFWDWKTLPTGVSDDSSHVQVRDLRRAAVGVYRILPNGKKKLMAKGYTDDTGVFKLRGSAVINKDKIYALICAYNSMISVNSLSRNEKGDLIATYCWELPGSKPETAMPVTAKFMDLGNLPLGTEFDPQRETAGVANIFNNAMEAANLLKSEGKVSIPKTKIRYAWNPWNHTDPAANLITQSYFDAKRNLIFLTSGASGEEEGTPWSEGDGDQWDDSVILHETAHWAMKRFAAVPPNTEHQEDSGECNLVDFQDELLGQPNLAYVQGWADFFSAAVRRRMGEADFAVYIDTTGGIGGGVKFTRDLESPIDLDTATGEGNWCEWQVAGALLDVLDENNDGADTITLPFQSIFKASRTRYNRHYPYTLNEWWYGWSNTLKNRKGAGLGAEQALVELFMADLAEGGHKISLGTDLVFRYAGEAPPAFDLEGHLWLPPKFKAHLSGSNPGASGSFPFAFYHADSGEARINIISPYPGKYILALERPGQNIAGSGARVQVCSHSSPLCTPLDVPAAGAGAWWKVLSLDGATGRFTEIKQISGDNPGPYLARYP